MSKRKRDLPPMESRPVFVMYTAVRRCRFNPSYDRLLELPRPFQNDVVDRWQRRHHGRTFNYRMSGVEVSRPPAPKKKVSR